jgi:imidazolonepropionase-like amidohydrolase
MKYAYTGATIIDSGGENFMHRYPGRTVLTDNDRIVDVCKGSIVPDGYEEVDLNGSFIMPGLINLHVHLAGSGDPDRPAQNAIDLVKAAATDAHIRESLMAMCEEMAAIELRSGVTTIRTVGGIMDFDTKIRDRIARGEIEGPRIFACNMAVSVPKGHMAGSVATIVHSTDEAVRSVRSIASEDPDWIKIMVTGGVVDAEKIGEPGVLRMSPDIVKAACDEAHSLGYKVAAHAESAEGVKIALRNGVDCIEHGAKPDNEMIQLFKDTGAVLVSTIIPASPYQIFPVEDTGFSEKDRINGCTVMDGIIHCASACLENGIPVGHGTDAGCPYISHYDFWRELSMFSKYCGISPAQSLWGATEQNARILGISDTLGSIQAGKKADMIVLGSDPLEDLSALRDPERVIKDGVPVRDLTIKKFERCEKLFDRYM